jgi:hypothetical protein
MVKSYFVRDDHVVYKTGTKKVDRLPPAVLAKAESIVIPEGAEEILERAFETDGNPWRTIHTYNTILKTVSLPSSLRMLGLGSFQGCRSLTRVDLTHCTSLTSMMDNVFACCKGLTAVSLPASLEMIGQYAFTK